MKLTGKQRLERLLRGEEVDHLASTVLVTGFYIKNKPQFSDVLDVHAAIGGDIICRVKCRLVVPEYDEDCVRFTQRTAADGTTVHQFETRVGTITEEYVPPQPWADLPVKSKGYISSLEDYKIYQYVLEHTHFRLDLGWYERCSALVGDRGIVVPTFTPYLRSSLECLVEDDLERTVYDLMDEPEVVEEFLQVKRAKGLEACALAMECPAPAFNIWEDTSTTLLSPAGPFPGVYPA